MWARFISSESGATAIEYGLIAALLGLGIVASLGNVATNIKTVMVNLGVAMQDSAN